MARPAIHAAEIALQIVLITAGCLAAAGLVTLAAVAAVRIRRRQLAARPPLRLVSSRRVQGIQPGQPLAIETAAVHLRVMSALPSNPDALPARLTSTEGKDEP